VKIAELKVGDIVQVSGTASNYNCIILAIGRWEAKPWEADPKSGGYVKHTFAVRGREYTTQQWFTHDASLTRDRVVLAEMRDGGYVISKSAAVVRYPVTDDDRIHTILHGEAAANAEALKNDAINEVLRSMVSTKMEVLAAVAGFSNRDAEGWMHRYNNPFYEFLSALRTKEDFIQQMFLLWMKYSQARGETINGLDPADLIEQYTDVIKEHRAMTAERPALLQKARETAGVQIGSDEWNAPLTLDGVAA
jgi:hypothetical protein